MIQEVETIVLEGLRLVSLFFDVFGVVVIAVGILWATAAVLRSRRIAYERYRTRVGRSLLLGLEILIAADIIRTIAAELSFRTLGALAVLVLIRTFLSWALEVELEGMWPWKRYEMQKGGDRS
ncbi:MAG: DUF1622 domain-containing protein [Candidatus Promineifilaceae bacterium]|nr:DUF1622 domain-containing protein [Candidatus Promineifilaceae bacterium]